MPVRSKSFTGCWTCRGRKIKCDLGQPSCAQCLKANIKCQGYSIKLRWTGDEADPGHDRRTVEFVKFPPNMLYDTYKELDDALSSLTSPGAARSETTTISGPFGVFVGVDPVRSRKPDAAESPRRRKKRRSGDLSSNSARSSVSPGGPPPVPSGPSGFPTGLRANIPPNVPGNLSSGMPGMLSGMQGGFPGGLPSGMHGHPGFQSGPPIPHNLPPGPPLRPSGSALLGPGAGTGSGPDAPVPPLFDDPTFMAAADPDGLLGQGPFLLDPHNELEGIEEDLLAYFPANYIEDAPQAAASEPGDGLFEPARVGALAPNVPVDEPFRLGASPAFTAQARFLLWHYKFYVTPAMTFVIHARNPWRTIYLPRAYAALGDISGEGTTTHERYTLLYAVLATGAFHVRNKYRQGEAYYAYYNDLALRLRQGAKSWLSKALHSDFSGKYKDLLVALLTMVTLDFVRGQESTALAPLGAAQRLINLRYSRRPRLSRKALILHRICLVLTLLQKASVVAHAGDAGPGAAALGPGADKGDAVNGQKAGGSGASDDGSDGAAAPDADGDAWMDRTLEDGVHPRRNPPPSKELQRLENLESRRMPLSYMDDQVQLEEYLNQYEAYGAAGPFEFAAPAAAIPNDYEAVSTQLIHGIPDSLVYVLKQVVDVSRRALRERERSPGGQLGPELSSACTHVEALLSSWKAQFETTRPTDLLVPAVNEAVMHHSLAFHEALVVYHYRIAKDVNRALLQPVIERVMEHLEEIIKLNGDTPGSPVAVPFLFAGFICGCEVAGDNGGLRTRYDLWFREMRTSGLSTYETAIKVVGEVNRRRAAGASSNWWDVIREWGVTLVLI